MVESQDIHPSSRRSPIPYLLKMTVFVTSALTVAGGSWYVAVNMTTASDLTAIYNCSAFFAYAFSIPLLNDKLRADKVFAVGVAIVGVLVVAYGGHTESKKTPDGTVGTPHDEAQNRLLGNIIIGIGSVLYGLYEVLYKRYACPPEGISPGRSMIFANTFGSLIGCFTLTVLWIPLPILHVLGLETFRWPTGEAAWLLGISVLANASEFPLSFFSPIHTSLPRKLKLTTNSILRRLPRPHFPHLPRPLLCRRPPHHLPRRHRRLDAHRPAPFHGLHHRRCPHHSSLLPPQLEHLPRDERGTIKEVGTRAGRVGE